MIQTLCLFGATMLTTMVITSCSKEAVVEKPKNYCGTQPSHDGTPKEAFYAFFGGVLVIVFLVLFLLKKMRNRK